MDLELLNSVSRLIADQPRAVRAGWVIYILEFLDNILDDDEFSDLLTSLASAVQGRLELGLW